LSNIVLLFVVASFDKLFLSAISDCQTSFVVSILRVDIKSTKLTWALAQILPDILISFCLSLITVKSAGQKLLPTFGAWRCGGI